jgi:hypothetical protein
MAFVYNRLASLQAILLVPPFTLGGYNILPLTPFNFFGSFYRLIEFKFPLIHKLSPIHINDLAG